jgi:hypothetical protein
MVCGQQKQIARSKRLDDLPVDLIADVGLAFEHDDVLEVGDLGDTAIFVAYVYQEQKKDEDIVPVLACIHAAMQFVITGAEGGVGFGFSNRHGAPFPT